MAYGLYVLILLPLFLVSSCKSKKVIILDMPIKKELLPPEVRQKVKSISNQVEPINNFPNCRELIKEMELFFEYGLAGTLDKIDSLKHTDQFESFSQYVHGYYIFNLVATDSNAELYHVGLRPTLTKEDIANISHYLDVELPEEFKFISKHLREIRPDIVNISGSETIEENVAFFVNHGFSSELGLQYALRIYTMWDEFWKKLIQDFPETIFNVAAGNGGRDWRGDELSESTDMYKRPTPAYIRLPNVKVIGSVNDAGRSPFSNFGPFVTEYQRGEMIAAPVPCGGEMLLLKLTGTSQSTAIQTNLISN